MFCLLAIVSVFTIFIIKSSETAGKTAKIYLNSKLVRTVSLNKDCEFKIKSEKDGEKGYNIIRVKNGKISVIESDCKNQICVRHGAIDNDLLPIVCVPNGLVIRVESDDESEIEASV